MLRPRITALLVIPFLIASIVSGAIDQGYGVSTFRTLADMRSVNRNEETLAGFLQRIGIEYAASDFWVAYRVTFLSREHTVVLPMLKVLNYYPPYEEGFLDAPRIAYICPEQTNFAGLRNMIERTILARHDYTRYDHVAGYTVYVLDRRAPKK